jgi:carbon-monoxide dehydrogenase medium subunit
MTTALKEDELLVEVRLPLLPPNTRFGFFEFSRRAGDFAIAMALVIYRVDDIISSPQVAVGGAEPHSRRIAEVEAKLDGRIPGEEAFAVAADIAANVVDPITDATNNAEFRRDLVRVVMRSALERSRQ